MAERGFFISDKNIEVVMFNQCQVETLVRSRMKGELHLKNELLIISVSHGRESFFLSLIKTLK
jgi:hypothetical protein